jgi:hypothetical protein
VAASPSSAERFFTEQRRVRDPALRAALLSSSFEYWRAEKHPYPIYLPPSLQNPLPPRAHELPGLMRNRRDMPGYYYARGCVDRGLARCVNHPKYGSKYRAIRQAMPSGRDEASVLGAEGGDANPIGVMAPDIDFDADEQITTARVRSRFDGVTAEQAADIIDLSAPVNWAHAAPTFFERSIPVLFDPRSDKLELDRRLLARDSRARLLERGEAPARSFDYKLQEFVDWAWTPSLTGGMVNVLAIEEYARDDRKLGEFVDNVVQETGTESLSEPLRPELSIHYTYSLVRCQQSKFVSTWDVGGLDVDEGHLAVVWDQNSHSLFIESQKSVRYSHQADVFPGFSSVLNLLAPSVISMLMKHLAYEGVRDYLEGKRDDSTGVFKSS